MIDPHVFNQRRTLATTLHGASRADLEAAFVAWLESNPDDDELWKTGIELRSLCATPEAPARAWAARSPADRHWIVDRFLPRDEQPRSKTFMTS